MKAKKMSKQEKRELAKLLLTDTPADVMGGHLMRKSDLAKEMKSECKLSADAYNLGCKLEELMLEQMNTLEVARALNERVAKIPATTESSTQLNEEKLPYQQRAVVASSIANLRIAGRDIADQISNLRFKQEQLTQQHATTQILMALANKREGSVYFGKRQLAVVTKIVFDPRAIAVAWFVFLAVLDYSFGIARMIGGVNRLPASLCLGLFSFCALLLPASVSWVIELLSSLGWSVPRNIPKCLDFRRPFALMKNGHWYRCKCQLEVAASITEDRLQSFFDESKDIPVANELPKESLVPTKTDTSLQVKIISAELVDLQNLAKKFCLRQKEALSKFRKQAKTVNATVKAIDDLAQHLATIDPALVSEEILVASLGVATMEDNDCHRSSLERYQDWCRSERQAAINGVNASLAELKELEQHLKEHRSKIRLHSSRLWNLQPEREQFRLMQYKLYTFAELIVELSKFNCLFKYGSVASYFAMALGLVALLFRFHIAGMWWLWPAEMTAVIGLPIVALVITGDLVEDMCRHISSSTYDRYHERPVKAIEKSIRELQALQRDVRSARNYPKYYPDIPAWLED